VTSFQDKTGSGNLVPASRHRVEFRISNSRFIATIAPAFSVAEAKEFIREINLLYADATHNVPVYQIGFGSTVVAHSSDNGEPSGTAGRPALAVLMGSGLGDTALVITRYFGGTKLGTGGLVKAYSGAARAAINEVPKARKILVHKCQICCPYKIYEQVSRLLRIHGGIIDAEDFTDQVSIQFSIPADLFEKVSGLISELTNGQIQIHIIADNQISVLPIS